MTIADDHYLIGSVMKDLIKGIWVDEQDESTAIFKGQPFYGAVILAMNRKIDRTIPGAMTLDFSNSQITLLINPDNLRKYSRLTAVGILMETCMHLANRHMIRYRKMMGPILNIPKKDLLEEELKEIKKKAAVADIAMDMAVNQFIKPYDEAKYVTGERFNPVSYRMLKNGEPNQTWETYYYQIMNDENLDNIVQDYMDTMTDSHVYYMHAFEDCSERYMNEKIKNIIRRAARTTSYGELPDFIKNILDMFNKENEISWQNKLRGWAKQSIKYTRNMDMMRESSSIPGFFPGRKQVANPEFHAYGDTSGSVADSQFLAFNVECVAIAKQLNAEVWMHQFDTEVHFTTKADRKNNLIVREGYGGTNFDCIAEHARKNKIKNIIIMTDGYAPNTDFTGLNVFFLYTKDHQEHDAKKSAVLKNN